MGDLVYLDPNDCTETPFTTSNVIAENGRVTHHAIQVLIAKQEIHLREFGKVSFEMRPLESGQSEKVYHLNEPQATLLITFMKNTAPVIKFKKALVREFYRMQAELTKRRMTREIGKQARAVLTEAISHLPESPHKAMKYKHYTDLVYSTIFGKNAKQLREQYGIGKTEDLRNRFSAVELETVEKLEHFAGTLLDAGLEYQTIKEAVKRKWNLRQLTA